LFLSDLKINGFKSFANKTELKFSKGLTCIIGPNGSGKSNIVDAMRWVIGEQKAGTIRSDKMTDVIFNGADSQKPLGMAEVNLHIENNKGILPSEYSEVNITRRVYRSGQSEYLLNGTKCRLKDIQNLFMDKGMGSGAYSVIELKMVEQILSNNPAERRQLFEEAAGIKKYKSRRNSAQKKLEHTKEDFLRVNDLAEEVKRNVNSLARQAAKVKRYKAFKEELKNLEIYSLAARFKNFHQQIIPLEKNHTKIKSESLEIGKQLGIDEALIENYKLELVTFENDLDHYRRILFEKDETIRKINEAELLSKEKQKNKTALVERLNFEIEQLQTRIKHSNKIIQEKRELLTSSQEEIENFDEIFHAAEENYQEIRETYDTHKEKITKKERFFREITIKANNIQKKIDQNQLKKEHLEEKIQNLSEIDPEKIKMLETTILQKKEEKEKFEQKKQTIQASITEEKNLLETNKTKIAKLNIDKKQLDKEYLQLESKRNLLEDTILSGKLHPEHIQTFIDESYLYESFLGIFADIIDINDGYESLFGKILQNFASLPVLKNPSNDELKLIQEKFPTLSLIIIPEKIETYNIHKNSIHNFIKSTYLNENELNYLFAKWIYLEKSENFTDFFTNDYLVFANNYFYDASSRRLHYKIYSDDGIQLIGAHKEIEKLDEKLEKIQEKIEFFENQIYEKENSITKIEKNIQEKYSDMDKLHDPLTHLSSELKHALFEKNHYLDQIKNSENEVKKLNIQLDIITKELKADHPILESISSEEAEIEEELINLKRDESQKFQEFNKAKDELNEVQIALKKYQSEEEKLKDSLRREYYFIKESENEVEKKQKEKIELENSHEDHSSDSSNRQQEIEELSKEKEKILNEKAGIEDKYITLKEKIDTIEKDSKLNRQSQGLKQKEIQSLELKINELYIKSQTLYEEAKSRYQSEITDVEIPEDFNLANAEYEIIEFQNKIEKLGEINALAIEEHTKEKERLDFLTQQLDDIQNSQEILLDTIKTINDTAQKQFQEIFKEIRSNFQTVFHQFFKNGEGDLSFTQGDDPLDGKIDIVVRPKGRQLQTLSLMSGGEKTLTAISLLFAIYLVKPSPFCILDEVDAPLDDVNIKRFTDALENFTDKTQFIVVTHNKRTMEAADYMYGVTQEKVGISKLVSVKFD
jgi:chromosome segregation protein